MKERYAPSAGREHFSTFKSPLFTPGPSLISRASAGFLPCRSTSRARLEGKPAEPRGNDTGLTRWCQVTETFSSSGNSGRMFSTNSFHDLVIPISVNWNGSEKLSCPSSHIFVLLSLQPLFCSHSKMSHCFSVIVLRSFFFPGSSRPTIQSTCDSLLLLPGYPITPTIYLSSSHSILCLCLFNTRWSCLPGIGCLRCDAERFPIDGMERTGRREGESEWRL